MPLYPYRCTQCGYKFEKIQSFSSKPETECPKCHGPLERPLTAPGLHFKGAGWYVNDYASKGSSSSESSTASSSAAPAKPAEKAAATTPCGSDCSKSCPAAAAAGASSSSAN